MTKPPQLVAPVHAGAQAMGPLLTDIKQHGFARVRLNAEQQTALDALWQQTIDFSKLPAAQKSRYSLPKLNNGYRPLGAAHAGDPDVPDYNDSFLYWGETSAEAIAHRDEIQPLLSALEAYRSVVAVPIMSKLVAELCHYYGTNPATLPFEGASVLQFNSFDVPTDRELLQTRHEDGVVATIIWTSAPGLEAYHGDQIEPLTPEKGEVFIMPGGILEAMTGGEFEPLYHQARNHNHLGRKSIMYFSNFDPRPGKLAHFVSNEHNKDKDLTSLILGSPDMFGLPDGFYVETT